LHFAQVLPGFVTLSSDPEEDVRISAIRGLGTVLASGGLHSQSIMEKTCFQFLTYLDDSNQSHFTYMEVIAVAADIWSELPSKLREEVFLTRMAAVYLGYGPE
jgi:hypothetical protein